MANYILEASEKEDKIKKHEILTRNRLKTIQEREISFEQLLKEENNELSNSYIQSLEIKKNENKNKLLCHKISLTEKDKQNKYIQQIEEQIKQINSWIRDPEYSYKEDIPKLKSLVINLRKDEFLIKSSINKTIIFTKLAFNKRKEINYYAPTGYENEQGQYIFISDSTFYFHNFKHLAALLQNYQQLKESNAADIQSTMHWILIDFENLVEYAFENNKNEKYKDIVLLKMKGLSNEEINEELILKYGKGFSINYMSSLLNKNIPKLLADKYKQYTNEWYYTYKQYGKWKTCTKCGKVKLANTYNFAVRKSGGKYGLRAECKECR